MLFSISSVLLAVASLASTAAAASLQQVTNYGSPTGSAQMFIYVPDNVKPNPAIVVGIHWCSGNAQAFYTGTSWKAQADQYGFIIIYPSTVNSDGCWDVHSTASLTHNGGSDSLAIRTMVSYTISRYSADASRVYATGHSSGGMMTSVLLGTYPDVFKAGSAFAGVPFACFAGTSSWSSACANGQITRTPAQWGDLVRAAYPGFTGTRPRVQIWHGTQDDTLNFHNFDEEIKQWTNVFGLSQTPTTTENNPFGYSGWVRTKYGTQFEAVKEQGQPHNLLVLADQACSFFGIPTYTAGPPGSSPTSVVSPTSIPSGPSTTIITSPTVAPTGGPTGPGVAKWGQCGGIGYNGPTNCVASTCTVINAYYSQCL